MEIAFYLLEYTLVLIMLNCASINFNILHRIKRRKTVHNKHRFFNLKKKLKQRNRSIMFKKIHSLNGCGQNLREMYFHIFTQIYVEIYQNEIYFFKQTSFLRSFIEMNLFNNSSSIVHFVNEMFIFIDIIAKAFSLPLSKDSSKMSSGIGFYQIIGTGEWAGRKLYKGAQSILKSK